MTTLNSPHDRFFKAVFGRAEVVEQHGSIRDWRGRFVTAVPNLRVWA
jgi:hypothetical protein